jgi:hypothetical protein
LFERAAIARFQTPAIRRSASTREREYSDISVHTQDVNDEIVELKINAACSAVFDARFFE